MTTVSDVQKKYYSLRNNIDKVVHKLETEHKKQMLCKSGCDLCCMDYNIFPVEYYSILNELKIAGFVPEKPEIGENNSCVFLKNHKCTIYQSRPIICRTHGLPLLFANEEGEWELSACELNFTEFDFEDFTFDNTFPQDKFNSKLFLINKDFIQNFREKEYSEFDLIPLKNLLTEL